jgi:L-lactate dehydrogenase complex protein LldE
MIVDLFIPCFVDQFYPDCAMNMIKVLERVGCGVNYNHEQTCCGQPAFNAGYWDHCKDVGEKFIKEFQADRYIVSPSASCTGFVRNYYGDVFQNSVLHNQFRQVQKNMYEFSDFLVNILKITDLGARLDGVATFHDSCSGLRECGIHREPRVLLSKVRGLELREMNHAEVCCGFGGSFAVKHENIAVAMADEKLKAAEATQADYLISTDMSCLMHIDGFIKKQQKPMKVMHLVDVLAAGWD